MEEAKVEELNISFHCISNNQAEHFCFNPQCQISAIVCAKPKCKCVVDRHDDCGVISAQRLIGKIMGKKTNLSKELIAAFQTIDKIYVSMIQKLSQDRQQLELIKENYGLSTQQAHFLQLVKNRQIDQITGKIVYFVKNNVQNTNQIGGVTQENVREYWQHQRKNFDDITRKLKAIYTDRQTIKPIEFKWSSYSEKEGFSIEKNILSKTGNHLRTNVAITEPAMSSQKRNFVGIKISKITNAITIGIAQQSFYKKQELNNFGGPRQNKMYSINTQGNMLQTGINRGNSSFNFGTGDTIYFMYDPYSNQLKLCKNEKDGFVIFKNVQKSECFCVLVTGLVIGDQVELVNEVPEIDWNRSHFVPKALPSTNNPNNIFGIPAQRATTLFPGQPPRPPVMSSNLFQDQQ